MSMRFRYAHIAVALLLARPGIILAQPADLSQRVSVDSLNSHVRILEDAGGYRSRVTFTPGNDSAAVSIREMFESIPGLTGVELDTFTIPANAPYTGRQLCNVVATLRGRTRPSDVLLLGAHYDASASRMGSTTWNQHWSTIWAPGADDNATGVACLLEIARLLSDPRSGYVCDITLKFVAFASEESGPAHQGSHGGSGHYAASARLNGENILGMLSIDMIGYNASHYFTSIVSDTPSIWLGDRFRAAVDSAGIQLQTNTRPYPTATYSDHERFWAEGFSAILLIEHAPPWTSSPVYTANPYYHTSSDTLGTLAMELVRRVTQGVLALAVSMGGGVVTGVENDIPAPSSAELFANYPNPFNPTTVIRFRLPEAGLVRLGVYDVLGREATVLLNGWLGPGLHTARFDGAGRAAGVYFYRLETRGSATTRAMLLLN